MKQIFVSYIEGDFEGWDGNTIFKFDNGQIWIQDMYSYTYHYAYRPKATIYQENGRFILIVEGLNDKVQVRPLDDYFESSIDGEFHGWDGSTKFKLVNGQVWIQTEYSYTYSYSYCPNVIIYNSNDGYRMKVDGMDESILVRRIK